MEIAPFRGLRYSLDSEFQLRTGAQIATKKASAEQLTSPPYDVISPDEHRDLLARSPYNITRLTLGDAPGEASSYAERRRTLRSWIESGVLVTDENPSFYVYTVDYRVPGDGRRARLVGLVALGKLTRPEDSSVLPHEQTFPKVVEDRQHLLEATRANLESILLLYSDPDEEIDRLLDAHCPSAPVARVEAKPRETHALYRLNDLRLERRLTELMKRQRPIIADGHHRYTTSRTFWERASASGEAVPGAGWQLMTFANLHSGGLSILPTHRLLTLRRGAVEDVFAYLRTRLSPVEIDDWDIAVETAAGAQRFRFPDELRSGSRGVARSAYAILQRVIIGDWLRPWIGNDPEIAYFKEGTGEREALRSGKSRMLFRMQPVDRNEFQDVVEGGELFPHKTTYFYPKLWSGLVLWALREPSEAGSGPSSQPAAGEKSGLARVSHQVSKRDGVARGDDEECD